MSSSRSDHKVVLLIVIRKLKEASFMDKKQIFKELGLDERDLTKGTLEVFSPIDGKKIASCLLYTSPSPRDLSTSRMPSSA